MIALLSKLRFCFAALLFLTLSGFFAAPALAQSCNDDIQKLTGAREAQLKVINGLVAAARGKQIDPAVFCARSGGLNAADNALLSYLVKNKDWCQVPDNMINGLKASHAQSVGYTGKACTVAAQIRTLKARAAEQAKNGGGGGGGGPQAQALPTGPL